MGDASCITKVVDIVRTAAREAHVAVVVSAMSGVTNRLLDAAKQAEEGDLASVAATLGEIRTRHEAAASSLVRSIAARRRLIATIWELLQQAERSCERVSRRRKLTLRDLDAVLGLGERLSAPVLAASLVERGVASVAVDATELVVTNGRHGAARPNVRLTFERCEARLRPLLSQGLVPVVTGFIGATQSGVPTTLGRNSSDYSGALMGAALNADEVTLWTDVDGVLTADPKLVPDARPILEMSYREASDLAAIGAKVLHTKTLIPVMGRGIPLVIRNTFAPDRHGTRITVDGSARRAAVRAISAQTGLSLITIQASSVRQAAAISHRVAKALRSDMRVLLPSQACRSEVSVVVPTSRAGFALEKLFRELARDFRPRKVHHVALSPRVCIVTVVGCGLDLGSAPRDRIFRALDRENLEVFASGADASDSYLHFVVASEGMRSAVAAIHREFDWEFSSNGSQ